MLRAQNAVNPCFGPGVAAGAAALAVLLCTVPRAESNLHHGVVWYSSPTDTTVLNTAASRFEIGVTGKDNPTSNIAIKQMNPSFQWFVYNSGTDNYVPPNQRHPEYDLLIDNATARGWDPEEAYAHYWNDTQLVLGGDTLFIPGWGGGSATSGDQSRVPVYYGDRTRAMVNFSTPRALQLNKEVFIELSLDTPFDGSTIYPDGIFLDNSAWRLFHFGTILSGGEIREAPGHPVIGSDAFKDWHWNQNYGPFLTALKDTLETSATWSPDHKRKRLMINTSNIWDDSYVTKDVADVIFMEFAYNSIRDNGIDLVDEAYRRDTLCAAAGIDLFYPATTATRSVPGHEGALSYGQIMLGNLAFYLAIRTDKSIFFEMGTASPHIAGWDTLTWRGCLDVASNQLGEALGPPFNLSEGTDPMGNPYILHARNYEGGLVVIRNRGEWSEGVEPETAVTASLPAMMSPVGFDGTIGAPADQVTLRNGEGAIFLLEGHTAVTLLSFSAIRTDGRAAVTWTVSGDASDVSGFNVYREDAGGDRVRMTETLLSGGPDFRWVDEAPPAAGTRYWVAATTRGGSIEWFGPATLAPTAAISPAFALAQNVPNPFRSATAIHFTSPVSGRVVMRVLDLSGREVARPLDAVLPAGDHVAAWDGTTSRGGRAVPGVYFYRIEGAGRALTRKLTLLP